MLKLICSVAGLFGGLILLFAFVAHTQGMLASLGSGAAALKLGGTVVRAAFLLLCAWAAWRSPQHAALFAWGAFAAFVFSGAADEVVRLGFKGGFANLMPTYYVTALAHALFAAAVWVLARRFTAAPVGV